MIVNIEYTDWIRRYQFPTISLDLDTLEIGEKQNNIETIKLNNTVNNNNYEFYVFKFIGTNNFEIELTIVSFKYNTKKYTAIFWSSNGLERVDIATTDNFDNPTTVSMPEYVQISNGDDIVSYKIFTRYQDTYYYKGHLFGNDRRFWISYDMFFKSKLLKFTYDYLLIIIDNMTQPFYSDNIHILYNFITSCFRDPRSEYVLLPPVLPLTQNENTLI